MAKGTKLASGYIELDIQYTDALKKITKDLTDLEKLSKKAGDEANKNLGKATDDTAKSIDRAVKSTKQLGDETKKTSKQVEASKKAVTEFGKGLDDSKKKASDVGDALAKGVDKGAKQASKSISDSIIDGALKASQDGGQALSDALVKAAGEGGKAFGQMVGDSRVGHWLQDMSKSVQDLRDDYVTPAVDGMRSLADGFKALQEHDPTGALNGVSGALKAIGQNDAAASVAGLASTVDSHLSAFNSLNGVLQQSVSLLESFAPAAAAAAGPWAAIVAAGTIGGVEIGQQLQKAGDSYERDAFGGLNDKDRQTYISHGLPVQAPIAPRTSPYDVPQAPPTEQQAQRGLAMLLPGLPKKSDGGVIKGPGTGISDSILGVDANGVPTARVSAGEGIVKAAAMKNGAASIVAALNSGSMKLPGYDDGTTNVGGPEIPVPKVDTSKGSPFNQWLGAQQGKAYQYGTLYDCSGFMSQVYNQLTGKQMPRFNTESDLRAYGFVPGSKPGTFQLGIHHGGGGPNSHMAGTLPDGRAVESAGNGVQIGPGAHGANDKQFEDHWFLPGSEGMGSSPMAAVPGMAGQAADPAALGAMGAPGGKDLRTQGFIPAGAGGGGTAGSSFFSGSLQMGAQAINGLIDQAASAASQAASMGANAFAPGSGGAAGSAASTAIGIGTQAAKRGVQYGFQMAGIVGDAATEILMPFGVPRFFQTDPSQFMPQLPGQAAAVTTGEKAEQSQDNPAAAGQPDLNPSGPVQPGQTPGQQPVGSPAAIASPGTGDFKPAAVGTPALAGPKPVQNLQDYQDSLTTPPSGQTPQVSVAPAPPPAAPPPAPKPPQQSQQGPMDWLINQGVVGTPNVFDDGGWLMPNQVAINKSSAPEPILNAAQWDNIGALAKRSHQMTPDPSQGASNDYSMTFNEGSIIVKDVNELQSELASRQRLRMMQHAGRP